MSEINFLELFEKLFILDNITGSEFFGGQEISSIDPLKFQQFWEEITTKIERLNEQERYFKNINLNEDLTNENIKELLQWKQQHFVKKYWKSLVEIKEHINNFRHRELSDPFGPEFIEFYNRIAPISTEGPIIIFFIIHIAKPVVYPIIDQHVIRAFMFFKEGVIHSISNLKKEDLAKNDFVFFKLYVQFFMKIIAECRLPVNDINSHRNVDRSLWSCGKYLKAKRDIKRLKKKWREYTRSNSS